MNVWICWVTIWFFCIRNVFVCICSFVLHILINILNFFSKHNQHSDLKKNQSLKQENQHSEPHAVGHHHDSSNWWFMFNTDSVVLINIYLFQDLYHLNSTPLLNETFERLLKIVKSLNFKQQYRRLATDSESKTFEILIQTLWQTPRAKLWQNSANLKIF